MAIGVIVSNRSIKGSCGGLNDIEGLKGACDICEGKKICSKRRKIERQLQRESRRQALADPDLGSAADNRPTFTNPASTK